MVEKIGNITLDLTWYPGEDLYSDGPEEQRMLQIAGEYTQEEMGEVISREKSWTVLYHMSPTRENIVRSLPITKDDRVLEIGAGCGAITGQLARMAKSVTCIDLSRKRSMINATRHRDMDNISILVGNFQDIEKNLTQQYDCITLIGVLEYAGLYISAGEEGTDRAAPYRAFLRKIRDHLADGGFLVTSIENRLGLKYWAGCREDHTGHFFEGLENYPDPQANVHTFSRQELERLFLSAGYENNRFYYPYPDYKLPEMIFSEDFLPEPGQLRRNMRNFDRNRMVLFDEGRVFDSLTSSGLFPEMSNSFLVISSAKARKEDETVLYAKYSEQRGADFAIKTEILQKKDGSRTVEKQALWPRGSSHILNMERSSQALTQMFEGSRLSVNRIMESPADKKEHGRLRFEFIGGRNDGRRTLSDVMTGFWHAGKSDEALAILHFLTDLIRSRAQEPFSVSESFSAVFGMKEYPWTDQTLPVTDLDMIPENILLTDSGKWILTDYEWTAFFPVPVKFVLWRICNNFFTKVSQGQAPAYWYSDEGFTREEMSLFARMENAWQGYIKKGVQDLQELYGLISPGARYPVAELFPGESSDAAYEGSLFMENGTHAEPVPLPVSDGGAFCVKLPLGACGSGLSYRWDPLEGMLCRIKIASVEASCEVSLTPENGFRSPDGDEFWTMDPVYKLTLSEPGTDTVTVRGKVEKINLYAHLDDLNRIRAERDAYKKQTERYRSRLRPLIKIGHAIRRKDG